MGQRNPNHQLKTVIYPIIYRVSTIRLVVQDFFHPQYHAIFSIFGPRQTEKTGIDMLLEEMAIEIDNPISTRERP